MWQEEPDQGRQGELATVSAKKEICQVCGNGIAAGAKRCPYCNSIQEETERPADLRTKFYQKTVNLEQGRPTVEQALARLKRELVAARQEKIRIVTLIHGYGSSGKGGVIRQECRKTLDYLRRCGEIHTVIRGEDFHRRQGSTKHVLSCFPELYRHPHLNHKNKGITLVQLY